MSLEEWYKSLPIVTRTYVTLAFLTTAGCALEIITPYNVYYNTKLIFGKGEVWRLVTNFFFFGQLVQQVTGGRLLPWPQRRFLVDAAAGCGAADQRGTLGQRAVPGLLPHLHDGVCLGPPASVRHSVIPGRVHLHGPLPALGAPGLQPAAGLVTCSGPHGHGRRSLLLLFGGRVPPHERTPAAAHPRHRPSVVPDRGRCCGGARGPSHASPASGACGGRTRGGSCAVTPNARQFGEAPTASSSAGACAVSGQDQVLVVGDHDHVYAMLKVEGQGCWKARSLDCFRIDQATTLQLVLNTSHAES
ncbi:derlin [Haematococcus lacustris]|uniref:Derlin n=1 Tax=Haematococcus lacustris TaxID=44745 RepID=A0A699ZQZ1_HAELA|nr:derlin [Haematococcus lacustris]